MLSTIESRLSSMAHLATIDDVPSYVLAKSTAITTTGVVAVMQTNSTTANAQEEHVSQQLLHYSYASE